MAKEPGAQSDRDRRHSAPAERNSRPILEVLERVLPDRGKVLEIASGTGQHVVAFAQALPGLVWQPSDIDPELRASVESRRAEAKLLNLASPIDLDVTRMPWPIGAVDAVVCINMIHITPWRATDALFRGARDIQQDGGVLVTYGPYLRNGQHTAPSNEAFDASLRARNADWGLRDIDAVTAIARQHGFDLEELVAMPANNFTLVFRAKVRGAPRSRYSGDPTGLGVV